MTAVREEWNESTVRKHCRLARGNQLFIFHADDTIKGQNSPPKRNKPLPVVEVAAGVTTICGSDGGNRRHRW